MKTWLKRDTETTPLTRPRLTTRSTSCGPARDVLERCDVFNTILLIRHDVMTRIDTPITWQGLTEPAAAFNLVRPLTERYIALDNLSILYCLLSNRLQFLHDSANLPNARLNTSRAALCELLAIRVITHYAKSSTPDTQPGPSVNSASLAAIAQTYGADGVTRQRRLSSSARSAAVTGVRQRRMSMAEPPSARLAKKRSDELTLANVLIAGFRPFAGAPEEVKEEEEMEGRRDMGRACNALELAIVTEAKRFIACAACQKVLESVWRGRIYYTPSSFFDVIPDRVYKQKAITIYDSRKAPLLDHYRLRVPVYRALLEFSAFMVVFALMLVVQTMNQTNIMTWWEVALMVYASGWAFDRLLTTLEHGWRVFAASIWNGVDVGIIALFGLYLPIRLYGFWLNDHDVKDFAMSILSCESALLFPRLAFTLLKRNVLVMSLRAMMAQFGVLMLAAVWIFVGFWHALYTLDEGNYGVWEIAKYMTNIWFGLDSTGFDISTDFHPQLGPIIFFIFACLANTLFLTIVVAILSHTFAELNQDAKAEYMFRHAVGIVEGVKSDALFSFQPPLNIVALFFLAPASWTLSPRAFHRLHVFFTRLTNAPVLLLITLFERARHFLELRPHLFDTLQRALPKQMQNVSIFMSGAHGDVYAVFDYAPDTVLLTKSRNEDAEYDDDDQQTEADAESGFSRWPTYDIVESPDGDGGDEDGDEAIEDSDNEEGSQAGSGGPSSPTVPEPRGRGGTDRPFIGMPKTNTIGADSILSTSPSTHLRRLASGKTPKLHFDDTRTGRRASQTRVDTSPAGSNQSGGQGQGQGEEDLLTLQQMYPAEPAMQNTSARASGHVGGGRRQSLGLEMAGHGREEGEPPAWAKGLGEMLRKMEERQERIEGMLKMAPGEGD